MPRALQIVPTMGFVDVHGIRGVPGAPRPHILPGGNHRARTACGKEILIGGNQSFALLLLIQGTLGAHCAPGGGKAIAGNQHGHGVVGVEQLHVTIAKPLRIQFRQSFAERGALPGRKILRKIGEGSADAIGCEITGGERFGGANVFGVYAAVFAQLARIKGFVGKGSLSGSLMKASSRCCPYFSAS